MLSNAYLLANFRFDTAENEPAKICKVLLKICKFQVGEIYDDLVEALKDYDHDVRRHAAAALGNLGDLRAAGVAIFGNFLAKFRSFSAVSAPIIASKYAFCSIFQNLPDYLAEFFENWHHFLNFATIAKILLKFHRNC